MHARSLRTVFRRIVLASLSAPLVSTAACGGKSVTDLADATPPDDGQAQDVTQPQDALQPVDASIVDTGQADSGLEVCILSSGNPDASQCTPYDVVNCVPPPNAQVGQFLSTDECRQLCGTQNFPASCQVVAIASNGNTTISCNHCLVGGRRPPGFTASGSHGTRSRNDAIADAAREPGSCVGDLFARLSHLEAASVDAFRILRDDLVAHGAPRRLVRAAERAARDEVRHARAMGVLARRHGGAPTRSRIDAPKPRTLEAIAMENATEGCVRETYGALVATWQARAAKDPAVARAMEGIARDETRHASLSWSIARWASGKLGAKARARIDAAREEAVAHLRRDARASVSPEVIAIAGIPSPNDAARLVSELSRALFS